MIRKITSLTALLSVLFLLVTSVVLYIVPAGRVAYWADYRLWGLTKEQWGNLHINLGVLFLLAIFLHTFYNWAAIKAYLKNRAREFRLFTAEFNIALILVTLFTLGTYFEAPPFSTVIAVGGAISTKAEKFYGEPPYGHAELSSLESFTKKLELDLDFSLQRLKNAGLKVKGSDQPLIEIAKNNQTSPQHIYLIISPESERAKNTFPKEPPSGLGKKPLIDLCQEYSVNCKTVLGILADRSIEAGEGQSIKQIADAAELDALVVYEILREGLKVQVEPIK